MLNIDLADLNKIYKDKFDRVSALLAINKPVNITSHDLVDQVRKILGTRRVGHAGTLDPFATGLMLILVGSYTKKAELLLRENKTYTCRVLLGIETDSYDIDGNVTNIDKKYKFEEQDVIDRILKLNGEYYQYVPIYSSVKVSGMKLRELARLSKHFEIFNKENKKRVKFILNTEFKNKFKNKSEAGIIEFELPGKKVNVDIKFLSTGVLNSDDLNKIGLDVEGSFNYLDLEVNCSKGTYIRQLAHDIGEKLETYGMLISLERTKIGDISLKDSIDVESLVHYTNE